MPKPDNKIEEAFEWSLWSSRFITLIPVIAGIVSSLGMMIVGTGQMIDAFSPVFVEGYSPDLNKKIIADVVTSVDLYLIGIVLLIFSFGVYELFVSKIDIGRSSEQNNILQITSLDQLKNKILKVIIMVLIVTFFKEAISQQYNTPLSIVYFGIAILAASISSYFIGQKSRDAT